MGHEAKWEYSRAVYERYRTANRKVKQLMLNEFCLNTGYHRKYVMLFYNSNQSHTQRRPLCLTSALRKAMLLSR